MAYPVNIEEAGKVYHIAFKTHHDRFALVSDDDIKALAAFMHQYKRKHRINIFAFSIMSNHVHLLLKNSPLEADAIKHFLRDTKREFAKYHNTRYGAKGHFWKRSYTQKHVDGDIQFVNTIVYILNNSVEANIVNDAADFPHSSFHLLLNKTEIKNLNKQNKFLNKKELSRIYARAKRQRFAEGLSEEEQAKRGLSEYIDEDQFKATIIQGRKRFKSRGPWLHYFPENKAHVDKQDLYISLVLTDDIPHAYRPDHNTLKYLCRVRIQVPKECKKSNKKKQFIFKVGTSNIIYESKSKKACHTFQQVYAHRLPVNALSSKSVVKTEAGWALIAPPGRKAKEA